MNRCSLQAAGMVVIAAAGLLLPAVGLRHGDGMLLALGGAGRVSAVAATSSPEQLSGDSSDNANPPALMSNTGDRGVGRYAATVCPQQRAANRTDCSASI